MDLELSADQRALLDVSRSFLEQSAPASDVRRMALERQELDPAYWKQGAGLGWTSMFVPERLGGGSLTGQPLVDLVGALLQCTEQFCLQVWVHFADFVEK